MADVQTVSKQPAKVTAPPLPGLESLVTLVTMVVVVAGLYLARDVLKFFEEPKPGYFRRLSPIAVAASTDAGTAMIAAKFPGTPSMPIVAPQNSEAAVQASTRPSLKALASRSAKHAAVC